MFSFKKLFHFKKSFHFNVEAAIVPESFGVNEIEFGMLVNELVNLIKPEDRLGSLKQYLDSSLFQKHKMDLSNPNHSLIIGYAFATAIVMQREIKQQESVKNVLKEFYPESILDKKPSN